MTPATVELFYGLLAVLGALAVVGLWLVRLLGARSTALAGVDDTLGATLAPNAVGLAFVVAALATAGSLYFSEVAGFEPCRLCWYQRIAMYPLVVLLGLAAFRRDTRIGSYVIPLALIGAAISLYHVALEWVPALDTGACGLGPSCGVVWFRVFGVISLPTMALVAFALVATLLAVARDGSDGRAAA